MLAIAIFLALVLVAVGLAVLGWVWLAPKPRQVQLPRWRRVLELVSLTALSLQILVFLAFEIYGFVTDNFGYRSEKFLLWSSVDFYLAVIVIASSFFGKGRSRFPVALSAVVLEIIWFSLGMGI